MATVYRASYVRGVAAHYWRTQRELGFIAREIESRARANLREARSSTMWNKIDDPDHITHIGSARDTTKKYGDVDIYVYMEGYKQGAMAIEFGHAPSGVFGPGGRLGHIKTRHTDGLYIMTRAAGLSPKMVRSSGRSRGKKK